MVWHVTCWSSDAYVFVLSADLAGFLALGLGEVGDGSRQVSHDILHEARHAVHGAVGALTQTDVELRRTRTYRRQDTSQINALPFHQLKIYSEKWLIIMWLLKIYCTSTQRIWRIYGASLFLELGNPLSLNAKSSCDILLNTSLCVTWRKTPSTHLEQRDWRLCVNQRWCVYVWE